MGSTTSWVTPRRILILLWKNLLFRKRHYVVTALEIILPTIFAILMAYLKAEIGNGSDASEGSTGVVCNENITTFGHFEEQELVLEIFDNICNSWTTEVSFTITYAPNNTDTNSIMEQVKSSFMSQTKMCVPINFTLLGFQNEDEVETFMRQIQLLDFETRLGLRFAVVFTEGLNNDNLGDHRKVAYTLRFIDFPIDTDELMPWFPRPGPGAGWRGHTRYRDSGFAGTQIVIEKAIIMHLSQTTEKLAYNISMQPFPYPPYCSFDFTNLYNTLLPQFLVQGFIFMVPSILRGVVSEKETGIKELMKMMGLPNWLHWVGWMLNSLIILVFSVTIVVLLFFIPFRSAAGAVIQYSDPSVWWVVLFLYVIASSAACFFVSAFFHKPTLATTVGVVLWLVSYYALSLPLEPQYQTLNLATKLAISLLPNMALYYSVKIMSGYEGQGVGIQWSNIGSTVTSTDNLCLGHMCLMFVGSTIFYIILTIYFENILPSKYGLRKPWYYIFQMSEWGFTTKTEEALEIERPYHNSSQNGFEEEPNLKIGIKISQLRKVFGKHKVAVDDISLNMFDGQITALLGHNGAGKTTTMSILTGLYSPTSGTAIVNGFDIKSEMEKVRENLGLCPQHNMLFNKLTVEEHLKFFGMIKGLSIKDANKETIEIMSKLQLADKKNTLSVSLSGGQKRKLSLGCALIGGTKVVILDEPTSGMDIESRRALWDILLEMRGQRTILLTTHFLEEADCLGDRIAIMADGKLQCCGSPMFLKKFYGTGYSLKMIISSEANASRILTTVQKHIESANLKAQSGSELTITIPNNSQAQSSYPALFSELETAKENLGIQTIGLSLTTMDEVFVKVGELHHLAKSESQATGLDETENWGSTDNLQDGRSEGTRLIFQQFSALFIKKFTYTYRKRRLFISQLIFPVLLVIAAILISNSVLTPDEGQPALKISLSDYKDPITLYSIDPEAEEEGLGDIYASIVGSRATLTDDVSQYLLDVGERDIGRFRERYIIAAEINLTNVKAMMSTIPYHAMPLSINTLSNTMLKYLEPEKQFSIEVTNHPIRSGLRELYIIISPNASFIETIPILFAVFMPIGLALLSASYIVFPIEERQCKAKQVQLMTGTSPIIYWGASFVWDYFFMLILICLMTACFPIFEVYHAFTNNGGAGVAFLILFTYGFGAIPFSYLLSLFTNSVPGGFSLVTIIHILTGMIVNLVVYGLQTSDKKSIARVIAWFGRLFPTFGAAVTTMSFTKTSAINSRCNIITEKFGDFICTPELVGIPGTQTLQMCCDNCLSLVGNCYEPEPYIKWYDDIEDQIGIAQEIMYMFIMGLVYMFILIAIEYGLFRKVQNILFKAEPFQFHHNSNDADVKAETERIQTLITSGSASEDAIVVHNICKSFGSFSAVSKLTFGVHYGECFGLLGVNGAGKTTSFRMLTGDEIISDGNAYSMMKNLKDNHKEFLSKIGYCPQFDGIISVLTGREMLELFSRLRGIPRHLVKAEANKWLTKLGLMENADVQCEKYSGGMKRRLSAAIAMVGDPPVLMLDEPTTGVDPVARRELWRSIASSKAAGQAIILTSHSMEECEALCTRLGIMVNGELQCIGGVEHLKSKFAQGFCLTVKLKFLNVADDRRLKLLSDEIIRTFDPCTLKDQHQNILSYQINNTHLAWDVLFKTMESMKSSYKDFIEEYSVSQTTLEEVFLSFARMQYPERKVEVSLLKKIITCQLCGCNQR